MHRTPLAWRAAENLDCGWSLEQGRDLQRAQGTTENGCLPVPDFPMAPSIRHVPAPIYADGKAIVCGGHKAGLDIQNCKTLDMEKSPLEWTEGTTLLNERCAVICS